MVAYLRLTDPVTVTEAFRRSSLDGSSASPESDAAFSSYAQLLLDRMPEPTMMGWCSACGGCTRTPRCSAEGDTWLARARWPQRLQRVDGARLADGWWTEPALPRVRFDVPGTRSRTRTQSAETLFGRQMAGHYWQEFVTATSSEQVETMLQLMRKVRSGHSRFRIARRDPAA